MPLKCRCISAYHMWKKEESKLLILDEDDMEGWSEGEKQAERDNDTLTIQVDKSFNSKMTEVFQGSNVEEILKGMFAISRLKSSILCYLRAALV